MQAKIIVELPSKKVDKEFIYNIPLYLDIKIGYYCKGSLWQ